MPRAVFDPRQMALNQTLQRNVFRKPVEGAPKTSTPPSAPKGKDGEEAPAAPTEKAQPIVAAPKVGPNEPCPCGSGKKSKKCCG